MKHHLLGGAAVIALVAIALPGWAQAPATPPSSTMPPSDQTATPPAPSNAPQPAPAPPAQPPAAAQSAPAAPSAESTAPTARPKRPAAVQAWRPPPHKAAQRASRDTMANRLNRQELQSIRSGAPGPAPTPRGYYPAPAYYPPGYYPPPYPPPAWGYGYRYPAYPPPYPR